MGEDIATLMASEGDTMLAERLLVPDPGADLPRPDEIGQVRAAGCAAADVVFGGLIGTDGSLLDGLYRDLRRGGWACAQWDPVTQRPGPTLYGSLPGSVQSILRAELYAVLQAVTRALGAFTLAVDNEVVVRGLQKGKRWCCKARRPHVDLWRQIWVSLEGRDDWQVVKVKSHKSWDVIEGMRLPERGWYEANRAADDWAKQGAELGRLSEAARTRYVEEWKLLKSLAKAAGRYLVRERIEDCVPKPERAAKEARHTRQRRTRQQILAKARAQGHDPCPLRTGYICSCCRAWAVDIQGVRVWGREACSGRWRLPEPREQALEEIRTLRVATEARKRAATKYRALRGAAR